MDAVAIRISDVVFSLFLILLLIIPMAIISFLIWLDDHGPALFFQKRVGRSGTIFLIIKFRTMSVDSGQSQEVLGDMSHNQIVKARKKFQTTIKSDPRITRIGKLLRSSHIDEIPQFFNVLRGDMSIVGVRPDTPVQQVDYEKETWVNRHLLRPGITGLAQLYSDSVSLAERTRLDMKWVNQPSYKEYVRVIFGTAIKVLKRTGN